MDQIKDTNFNSEWREYYTFRLNFYANLIVTEKEFSCKYTILILITALLMDQIKDQDSLRRKKD